MFHKHSSTRYTNRPRPQRLGERHEYPLMPGLSWNIRAEVFQHTRLWYTSYKFSSTTSSGVSNPSSFASRSVIGNSVANITSSCAGSFQRRAWMIG